MVLLQQLMQVATQPSPVKAVFTHDDIELAAVALVQHLIASSSRDISRPSRPSQAVDEDDVGEHHDSCSSDVPVPPVSSSGAAVADSATVVNDDVAEQTATSRTPRRRRTFAVRPPLPVVSQLIEMGFPRRKAEAAVKHLGKPLLFVQMHEYQCWLVTCGEVDVLIFIVTSNCNELHFQKCNEVTYMK